MCVYPWQFILFLKRVSSEILHVFYTENWQKTKVTEEVMGDGKRSQT
jgi:hypothetical protein